MDIRKAILDINENVADVGIIEVCGKVGLFIDIFLSNQNPFFKDFIEDGYHIYYLRHADDSTDYPSTIEKQVVVNFWGTLIIKEELEFKETNYITLTNEEIESMMFAVFCGVEEENNEIFEELGV